VIRSKSSGPRIMEFTKSRSQFFNALEQMTGYVRQTRRTLTRLGTSVARRLQEALHAIKSDLPKLAAISINAAAVTVAAISGQVWIRLQHIAVHLRQAQNTLIRLGRSVFDKPRRLQEALHAIKSDLRKLAAIPLNAAAATDAAISKQVWIRLQHIAVHLRQAQNTLIRFGRSVFDKPRRLQEVLRVRENALRMSLASSLDAIIVINGRRHFVDANPKALDLFGVSQTNMGKFTIDAFLSRGQIRKFDGNRSRFLKREAKRGKCEIRRLDGSLRVAECIYIANFVPFRHFCRFRNATETDQYRPATLRTPGSRPIKSVNSG
jgi:PAS domain S-box-containing protein